MATREKYCALVTGVAKRQGHAFAIAEQIASLGNIKCLILVDKKADELNETQKNLAQRFPDVLIHALNYDVVNLSELSNMFLEARRRVLAVNGTLDIVVNAVGASNVSDFMDDSTYLLRGLVDTSLTHLLLSTKMAFELMVKSAVSARRNALVINVSSDVGIDPTDPFRAAEAVARAGIVTMPRAMQPVFDFLVARNWDQNGDHGSGAKPGRVRICSLLYPADLPTPSGVKDQEIQRRITLGTPEAILNATLPTLAKSLAAATSSGQPKTVTATVADVAVAAKWILEDMTLAGRVVRVGKTKNDIWAVKYQAPPEPKETLTTKAASKVEKAGARAGKGTPPVTSGLLSRFRTGSPPDDHAPAGIASELIKLEDMELRPPREGIRMKL
jgi:short-subunit dehydrogenase